MAPFSMRHRSAAAVFGTMLTWGITLVGALTTLMLVTPVTAQKEGICGTDCVNVLFSRQTCPLRSQVLHHQRRLESNIPRASYDSRSTFARSLRAPFS